MGDGAAVGDRPGASRGSVAAVVLAGGASSRMGRDKASLPVGGRSLLERTVEAARAVADEMVVVAPSGHPAASLGFPVVRDAGDGPLAALSAGLRAVRARSVLVLGVDHPALEPALLRLVVGRLGDQHAVVCERDGRLEPLIAAVERDAAVVAVAARLQSSDLSLKGLLRSLGCTVVTEAEWRRVDPAGRSFVDLDSQADLDAFNARRAGDRPGGGPGDGPGDGPAA